MSQGVQNRLADEAHIELKGCPRNSQVISQVINVTTWRLKQGRIQIIQVSGSCRDEDEDAFAEGVERLRVMARLALACIQKKSPRTRSLWHMGLWVRETHQAKRLS